MPKWSGVASLGIFKACELVIAGNESTVAGEPPIVSLDERGRPTTNCGHRRAAGHRIAEIAVEIPAAHLVGCRGYSRRTGTSQRGDVARVNHFAIVGNAVDQAGGRFAIFIGEQVQDVLDGFFAVWRNTRCRLDSSPHTVDVTIHFIATAGYGGIYRDGNPGPRVRDKRAAVLARRANPIEITANEVIGIVRTDCVRLPQGREAGNGGELDVHHNGPFVDRRRNRQAVGTVRARLIGHIQGLGIAHRGKREDGGGRTVDRLTDERGSPTTDGSHRSTTKFVVIQIAVEIPDAHLRGQR